MAQVTPVVGLVFDLETYRFSPGDMAPAPVCVALVRPQTEQPTHLLTWHPDDGHHPEAVLLAALMACLRDGHGVVGHHVCYDFAVLWQHCPALRDTIVALYDAELVWDTEMVDRLWHIAAGRQGAYSLEAACKRWLDRDLSASKTADAWRTRYGELAPWSISAWPAEAVNYPLDDVDNTRDLWVRLMQECEGQLPPTLGEQCRGMWALHNIGVWGNRTDPAMVAQVRDVVHLGMATHEPALIAAGLGKRKPDGRMGKKMDVLRERICKALTSQGIKVPLTATKLIATEREVVLQGAPVDPLLDTYARWQKLATIAATYLTPLQRGTVEPLHVRYTTVVRTGRTSASGYKKRKAGDPPHAVTGLNVQNQPRGVEGAAHGVGVRECFVPRPGYVLVGADYSMIELRTLADVMLKLFGTRSKLLNALCAGADVHLIMAAGLLGIPVEECVTRYNAGEAVVQAARQLSKPINFGCWGGLGAASLVSYLGGYGIQKTKAQCTMLINLWRRTWPSSVEFFKWRSDSLDSHDVDRIIHPTTGFVRGDCTYCGGLNFMFQAPAAHGAKRAAYALWRGCYWDVTSPLYGVARVAAFVHDEFLLEVLEGHLDPCARELSRVMQAEMETVVLNVECPAEAVAMRRWSKMAKPRFKAGKLIPWEAA